jgi:hypothetical protein
LAVVDAGGYLDVDGAHARHASFPAARCARVLDRRAQARAGRALARSHDLTEQRAAHLPHLADAVARRALGGMRAGHAAGTAARVALHRHAHLDGSPRARHDLLKRELHHGLRVGTAQRTARRRPAREHVAAEERVEQVVEAEAALPERVGARGRAVGTEHVVLPAPLRIAQRVIRGVDLLEALRRVRILGVRVGVALARQLPVRALDLVVGRRARNAQHLVRVPSAQRESCCPSWRDTIATAACAVR